MPKPLKLEDFSTERLPFITGSHAYGKPNDKSDVDLVMLVDRGLVEILRELSTHPSDPAIRYGQLNLVLVTSEEEYDAWREATEYMSSVKTKTGATFTKDAAAREIDKACDKRGISRPDPGFSN